VPRPMACTIDHLALHRRITVIRGFTDARGVPHHPGESGVISRIELDWPSREIQIEWDRGGGSETLVFDLNATTGPGNGRMRDFFDAGDLSIPADPDKRFVEGIGVLPTLPPELPPVSDEPVRNPSDLEAAVTRIHALAGRGRFDEAEQQLRLIPAAPSEVVAEALSRLAERHTFDPAEGVYEWLRDRAISAWYSWGAEATSGGDGAARLLQIHPAMDRFQRLDRARKGVALD
jgi:hypothetical protein